MQRPRLTQRTAEALEALLPAFRSRLDYLSHDSVPTVLDGKRAIAYLEDTLRWDRARRNGR